MAGATEYQVIATTTGSALPSSYTGCHSHGSELYVQYLRRTIGLNLLKPYRFCFTSDGGEVELVAEGAEDDDHDHAATSSGASAASAAATSATAASSGGKNCHFHAGVEYGMLFLAYAGVLMYL